MQTVWETRSDTEADYYLQLTGIQEIKDLAKWEFHRQASEDIKAEGVETEMEKIGMANFLRNILVDQPLDGYTDALRFAHWLRTSLTSTEKQRKELIWSFKDALKDLEKPANEEIMVENDYEIIHQTQTVYEQEKEALQAFLYRLEIGLNSFIGQKTIEHSLLEKQVESNDYVLLGNERELSNTFSDQQAHQQEACNIPGSWPSKK